MSKDLRSIEMSELEELRDKIFEAVTPAAEGYDISVVTIAIVLMLLGQFTHVYKDEAKAKLILCQLVLETVATFSLGMPKPEEQKGPSPDQNTGPST